jgi:hypothetical protein
MVAPGIVAGHETCPQPGQRTAARPDDLPDQGIRVLLGALIIVINVLVDEGGFGPAGGVGLTLRQAPDPTLSASARKRANH